MQQKRENMKGRELRPVWYDTYKHCYGFLKCHSAKILNDRRHVTYQIHENEILKRQLSFISFYLYKTTKYYPKTQGKDESVRLKHLQILDVSLLCNRSGFLLIPTFFFLFFFSRQIIEVVWFKTCQKREKKVTTAPVVIIFYD